MHLFTTIGFVGIIFTMLFAIVYHVQRTIHKHFSLITPKTLRNQWIFWMNTNDMNTIRLMDGSWCTIRVPFGVHSTYGYLLFDYVRLVRTIRITRCTFHFRNFKFNANRGDAYSSTSMKCMDTLVETNRSTFSPNRNCVENTKIASSQRLFCISVCTKRFLSILRKCTDSLTYAFTNRARFHCVPSTNHSNKPYNSTTMDEYK